MIRFEVAPYGREVIIRKIRPVWAFERSLKWSTPPEGDECQMDAWTQETLGL